MNVPAHERAQKRQQGRGRPYRPLLCSVIPFLLTALSWPAFAQDPLDRKVSLNIPPQALEPALLEFSRQAQVQVILASEAVRGRTTQGFIGTDVVASDALARLLTGTELEYAVDGDTVQIRPKAFRRVEVPAIVRLAETQELDAGQLERGSEDRPRHSAGEQTESVEEVLVTGSRLARSVVDGPQPVNLYSAAAIRESGQTTVAGFLNTLPEVSLSTGEPAGAQTLYSSTTVQLRGLPRGTTLVVLNGRRTPSTSTFEFPTFDLNSIPPGAIDRIEIVPQGSSAIYGSDALAGVVNVILRDNIDGVDANAIYGFADGTDEVTANVGIGKTWNDGFLNLFGSYFSRTALDGRERSLTSDADYRESGGPDIRGTQCNPGNVYSTSAANLPGLASDAAGIPYGLQGTPTIQDFVPTAGILNRCSAIFNPGELSLVPESHRYSFIANGSIEVLPNLEVFAEAMYSRVWQYLTFGPLHFSRVRVPADNLFNPFGADVLVDYKVSDLKQFQDTESDLWNVVIGARGGNKEGWRWEIAAWQGESESTSYEPYSPFIDASALSGALESTDPTRALNLFTSGSPAPLNVLQSLFSPFSGNFATKQTMVQGTLRFPPMLLWAGQSEFIVGAEHSKLEIDLSRPPLVPQSEYQRNSYAVFGEARVPLLDMRTNIRTVPLVAATGAVRYDHSNDFGGATTTQFGLELRPRDELLFRATVSDAYRAPALAQVLLPRTTVSVAIFDPLLNEGYNVNYASGGNPNLTEETGTSWSAGVVWSGAGRYSLTAWSVKQQDRISRPAPQSQVDNESLLPFCVQRASSITTLPGRITGVECSFLNSGELSVQGLDLELMKKIATGAGDWTPRLNVSYVSKYEGALLAGLPTFSRLNRADFDGWAPRWKGVASMDWASGPYAATVTGRYVGSYFDYGSMTRRIGGDTFADVSLRYRFDESHPDGPLSGAEVGINIVNVFDNLPEYSNLFGGYLGYDPTQADIRGRFISVRVGKRW